MYFNNITSLGELKKQYRKLAMENHPDKGGDENTMKAINAEFSRLYDVWKGRPDTTSYATDFASNGDDYIQKVWNEYNWVGSRYKGWTPKKDIAQTIRGWLKSTYPNMKWSVRSEYNSIDVSLISAPFEPFIDGCHNRSINHYHLHNAGLTERGYDVFNNVITYVQSYNYDNSDIMSDYYDVNFYPSFSVGTYEKYFELNNRLNTADKPKRKRLTDRERTAKKVMGKYIFGYPRRYNSAIDGYVPDHTYGKILISDNNLKTPYSFYAYGRKEKLKAKVEDLKSVGIVCHIDRGRIGIDFCPDDIKDIVMEQTDKQKELYESKR